MVIFYEFLDEYVDKTDREKPSWFGSKKIDGASTPQSNSSPRIAGQNDLQK